MAITTHYPTLRIILLLVIFGCVTSNSLQSFAEENPYEETALREKRQTTVPELLTAVGIFLGGVLVFVAALLFILGLSLPIILGALGLVGLGLPLNVIVAQLAVLVLGISGKKRRDLGNLRFARAITSDEASQKLTAAQNAETTIKNLTSEAGKLDVTPDMNLLRTKANALSNKLTLPRTTPTTIRNELNQIVNLQNSIVVKVLAAINTLTNALTLNCPIINAGLVAPLTYASGFRTSLPATVPATLLAPLLLICENVALGEIALNENCSKLAEELNSISKAVTDALAASTKQMSNTVARAIVSCVPSSG